MPLTELVGRTGAVAPLQMGPTGVKVGVIWVVTTISNVVVVVH